MITNRMELDSPKDTINERPLKKVGVKDKNARLGLAEKSLTNNHDEKLPGQDYDLAVSISISD